MSLPPNPRTARYRSGRHPLVRTLSSAVAAALALSACTAADGEPGDSTRTLVLGAYTTPREAYGREILPRFADWWADSTGERVEFEESYLGSGAQARAIVSGFEADVAALSLAPDMDDLVRAGLVRRDWNSGPHAGIVTRSIVVIAVRAGNPKRITDWRDLTRPDVEVLTPNPRTSGGAMWNIAALYGAALRGHASRTAGDSSAAETLLRDVLARVRIMDKGARESMITFENGIGDAAITYENEVLVAQRGGIAIEYVIPSSTILIENPVAVVDEYAAEHGNRDLAHAFVRYLFTPGAQRAYATFGLRPVDSLVALEMGDRYPPVTDLFTIRDLGGWPTVVRTLFAPGGVVERASGAAIARSR